jgi:(S)-2-hydroxyglutarate dehydrogenase
MAESKQVVIVGGGIVGLTTAYTLLQVYSNIRVLVLEKEDTVAAHQTGRNSGVIHSGIYYKPGSLKANLCRAGKRDLERFCEHEGVPFERCGKVIVARNSGELSRLALLYQRAQENGVEVLELSPEELREREPYVLGVGALLLPETGIVSYRTIAERLQRKISELGGEVRLRSPVRQIIPQGAQLLLQASTLEIKADILINCAGLYSDRVAQLGGVTPNVQIIPFRGEYFTFAPRAERYVNHLIYPIPDPQFPFLGVHFTRMIDGGIEAGPNAVLAFGRESYRKLDVHPGELWETLRYRGFLRFAHAHWRTGLAEFSRSCSKTKFLASLNEYIPQLTQSDLIPADAGIRAQAILPSGSLVDDFLIQETSNQIHVLNAVSPAATASFAIARYVTAIVQRRWNHSE